MRWPDRFFHGTTPPYAPGDDVVPGEVGCGGDFYDDRLRVWACSSAEEAARWAAQTACGCQLTAGHRPRVFEVELTGAEPDPNVAGSSASFMATSAKVVNEVELPAESFRRW